MTLIIRLIKIAVEKNADASIFVSAYILRSFLGGKCNFGYCNLVR
jgi:hypothetical protein